VPTAPIRLRPATELASRVLLPGDPHRALAVAHDILDKPLMFNHARGLWGYTGTAADGKPRSIQSTGMGGPSAAIVCEELVALGARSLIRIGTCGALADDLELGDLLAADVVLPLDGTSTALGARDAVRPDPGLTDALARAGARRARVATSDLFYDPRESFAAGSGAAAVEMEAAPVLTVAELRGVRGACVLGVSDAGSERLDAESMERLGVRLGEVAYAALSEG